MNLLQDWTTAKKNFEEKTKEKKPSEKFWGIFRKSSGLEKACKALDDALKKGDLAGMKKALDAFRLTAKSYGDLLANSTEGKSPTYKEQLQVLKQALADIEKKFCVGRTQALLKEMRAFNQVVEKDHEHVLLLLEEAESQYQLCDRFLRELHKLATSDKPGDKSGTQKKLAANGVQLAFKNLGVLTQKMDRARNDSTNRVKQTVTYWRKNDSTGLKSQLTLKNTIEALPMSMKIKYDRAAELLDDGKKLLVTAKQALEGKADAEKLFANSMVNFVKRVQDAPGTYRSMVTNLDNDIKVLSSEYEKALKETQEGSQERTQSLAEVRSGLATHRKGIDAIRTRLDHTKEILRTEWDHFPQGVRDDPRFEKHVNDVDGAFDLLDESLEELKGIETKHQKLRDKLGK